MNKAVLGAPGRSRGSPHCPSVCLLQAGTLSPQLLENENILFYAPIPETLQSHMPLPPSDGESEAQHEAGCAWDHRDVAIFMQSPEPGPWTPPGLPAGPSFLLTLVLILDRSHGAGAEGGKTGAVGNCKGTAGRGGRLGEDFGGEITFSAEFWSQLEDVRHLHKVRISF